MSFARSLCFASALVVGSVASGCQSHDALPLPEVVPAGDVTDDPAHPLIARYWAELSPTGHLDLYELHPGNVIYRHLVESGVNYTYTGTATQDSTTTCPTPPCLPGAANQVTLFTD